MLQQTVEHCSLVFVSGIYTSVQLGVLILCLVFLLFVLHAFSKEGICHVCLGGIVSCILHTCLLSSLVKSNR